MKVFVVKVFIFIFMWKSVCERYKHVKVTSLFPTMIYELQNNEEGFCHVFIFYLHVICVSRINNNYNVGWFDFLQKDKRYDMVW